MNKQRRKKVENAISNLGMALDILDNVAQEEEEAFNNLPPSIQDSDKGDEMSEWIERLGTACCGIDEIINDLRL